MTNSVSYPPQERTGTNNLTVFLAVILFVIVAYGLFYYGLPMIAGSAQGKVSLLPSPVELTSNQPQPEFQPE